MRRVTLALLCAATLMAGLSSCTSDGDSKGPPSNIDVLSASPSASGAGSSTMTPTASSSTSSASATPTDWSPAVARQRYLQYVKPANAAQNAYRALGSNPSLEPLQAACDRNARSLSILARKLAAGRWPTTADRPIARLVVGITKERAGWVNCKISRDLAEAYQATRDLYDPAPIVEQVRIALGLPSA